MSDVFDSITNQAPTTPVTPVTMAPNMSAAPPALPPASAPTPAPSSSSGGQDIFDDVAAHGLPASDSTQTPPAPGTVASALDSTKRFLSGTAEGAVEGAQSTLRGVGKLADLVNPAHIMNPQSTSIADVLVPPEGVKAQSAAFGATGEAGEAGKTGGELGEGILEFVLGDEALKGVGIAQKLGVASKVADLAEKHPIVAKLVSAGLSGLRQGAVVSGQTAAKTQDLNQSLLAGGSGALVGTALGSAPLIRRLWAPEASEDFLSAINGKVAGNRVVTLDGKDVQLSPADVKEHVNNALPEIAKALHVETNGSYADELKNFNAVKLSELASTAREDVSNQIKLLEDQQKSATGEKLDQIQDQLDRANEKMNSLDAVKQLVDNNRAEIENNIDRTLGGAAKAVTRAAVRLGVAPAVGAVIAPKGDRGYGFMSGLILDSLLFGKPQDLNEALRLSPNQLLQRALAKTEEDVPYKPPVQSDEVPVETKPGGAAPKAGTTGTPAPKAASAPVDYTKPQNNNHFGNFSDKDAAQAHLDSHAGQPGYDGARVLELRNGKFSVVAPKPQLSPVDKAAWFDTEFPGRASEPDATKVAEYDQLHAKHNVIPETPKPAAQGISDLMTATSARQNQIFDDLRTQFGDTAQLPRDRFTLYHTQRVAALATKLAQDMGLDADAVQRVQDGSILHDIGKGNPAYKDLLVKRGNLTPDEYTLMSQHEADSANLVGQSKYADLKDIVGNHHTAFSKNPPLESQIISAADVYDSVREPRPYKTAMTQDDAIGVLQKLADDGKLSPEVVNRFAKGIQSGNYEGIGTGRQKFADYGYVRMPGDKPVGITPNVRYNVTPELKDLTGRQSSPIPTGLFSKAPRGATMVVIADDGQPHFADESRHDLGLVNPPRKPMTPAQRDAVGAALGRMK